MKETCALILTLATLASSAQAEVILRLADGAACRSADGVLRAPRVAPKPDAAAHRVERGMIATDEPVAGAPCYFYAAEVRLGGGRCPPAAVGGTGAGVAGTLGVTKCGSK